MVNRLLATVPSGIVEPNCTEPATQPAIREAQPPLAAHSCASIMRRATCEFGTAS